MLIRGNEIASELRRSAPGFKWADLRVVREVRFFEEADQAGTRHQNVLLTIETEDYASNLRCCFLFTDVRAFEMRGFGGGIARIVGFDVADLSNRQWEAIAWEVCDVEEGDFGLKCREVELVGVEELTAPPKGNL